MNAFKNLLVYLSEKKDIPPIKKYILLPGLRPMDPCFVATAPLLRQRPMDSIDNTTITVLQNPYFPPGIPFDRNVE